MSEAYNFLLKVQDLLQSKAAPLAGKINAERHISALKDTILSIEPLMLLGGFALVLARRPVAANWSQTLMILYHLTIGLLSLFTVIVLAYQLCKSYNLDPVLGSSSALLTFLSLAVPTVAPGQTNPNGLFLAAEFLGVKGFFSAIILGLLTVEVVRLLDIKGVKVRMPESVPPVVAVPLNAFIPVIINVVLFMSLNSIMMRFWGVDIPQAVLNLMTPLTNTMDSMGIVILAALLINILWFFGIHGGSVVQSLLIPFLTFNFAANAQAVELGKPLPHIFSGNFFYTFVNIGGSGAALSLALAMLIVARSEQLKGISRNGFLSVIFGISETFVFGTPIIMNPTLFIPFVVLPMLNAVLAYLAVAFHLVGGVYLYLPVNTPGLIAAFLSTMDWQAVLLWMIILGIDIIVYIPFIKSYDRKLLTKEIEN
ncbi:PTS transporter subunit EIIC [Desulfosporosinus sp. PR]|uniref:PTS sugar transporter subunit IIC n=1 Tax=Candidatus Desulfosporosinus nitrosoreducens TaxID=3401928 RepID=UPI0027EC666F|nr:PTS transporter subunit EIIC [Desulfosporosinus sp. PR]MDQ7096607.1 PTS transporter subunit EIIC [Desulfosporosinus sp. PR]